MSKVTVSPYNVEKPAPKWWRRLERALLIAFIPAAVMVIQSWSFKDEVFALRLTLIINVALVGLVKGTGMLLANGEEYTRVDEKPTTGTPAK
jgi:putative effector of murein hydrolase LrgA (UPF0299 family)